MEYPEKLKNPQLLMKFAAHNETCASLPFTQHFTFCPYPEREQSSP